MPQTEICQKTRVLVTDSASLRSELLANALREEADFQVLISEYDRDHFQERLDSYEPQVVLISADRTGIYGVAREFLYLALKHSLSVRVVIVLQNYSEPQIAEALRAGAWMVLTADQAVSDLIDCMKGAQPTVIPELQRPSEVAIDRSRRDLV